MLEARRVGEAHAAVDGRLGHAIARRRARADVRRLVVLVLLDDVHALLGRARPRQLPGAEPLGGRAVAGAQAGRVRPAVALVLRAEGAQALVHAAFFCGGESDDEEEPAHRQIHAMRTRADILN